MRSEAVSKPPSDASVFSMIISARHDPAARIFNVDLLAAMTAALLPWSTTGVIVLMGLWTLAFLFAFDWRAFLRSLLRPACILPLALFAIAGAGMFWADAPWDDRLRGLSQVAKLLAIPLLLYHFERSPRGGWVLSAFLASCVLVMIASWIVTIVPDWKPRVSYNPGVPVKNYIDQSQEFALCIFALAPLALASFRQRQWRPALLCAALMAGFFTDMVFVVSARTALIGMVAMLGLFAALYLSRRATLLLFAGVVVLGLAVWFASPYLRQRITDIPGELNDYRQNVVASTSRRLEYWDKSLKFAAEAPLFGNGTGSTRLLFERAASGQSGLAAEIPSNPHNQTLGVAVQWGLLGVGILYAMWLCHLTLFRGTSLPAWIGLIVVVQNFLSSLLNSHLFDFVEGWIYVLGVGIAGGMMRRIERERCQDHAPR